LLLACGLQLSARPNQDTISVDLKNFKFKGPKDAGELVGYNEGEGKLFYYVNGLAETTVKLPTDGDYEITIKASGDPALKERAKFKLTLDDKDVGKETELTADGEKDYTFNLEKAKAGEHKIGIEYTNDVYKENEYDRNFYVHGVTLKTKSK
jgi:hypothetical protein